MYDTLYSAMTEDDFFKIDENKPEALSLSENPTRLELHLILTAFENRFWGDENALKYIKDEKYVNRRLFTDYAKDWLFKNRKSS